MNTDKHIFSYNEHRKFLKQYLFLHNFHIGDQQSIHLTKKHMIALSTATCVLIGSSTFAFASYYDAKNELLTYEQELSDAERTNRKLEQTSKILQSEKSDYMENIQDLQNKAAELEKKIDELETVKNNLNDQLEAMNTNDGAAAQIYNAVASCFTEPEQTNPSFTPIVTTSYGMVTSLSAQLNRIDSRLNETETSFTKVATNVTETLAAYTDIPSGLPVSDGVLSTLFNPNGLSSISDGRVHKGLDISTRSRILPITATAAGTVIEASYHDEFGNYVLIDHGNGYVTRYAHNSENLVSVGDTVKKGDIIATTGSTGQSTGIHCHYEIILNGVYQDPLDFE